MNSFQILDKDNNPIPINILDEQAAIFWSKEVHPKEYASPIIANLGSWYDSIGFYIAYQDNYTFGWNNIKISMMNTYLQATADVILKGELDDMLFSKIIGKYRSYFQLIDYWNSLGYQPKQIKE